MKTTSPSDTPSQFPKQLSDSELYQKTSWLAQEERRITLEFLHYLAELTSRKLHIQRGYSSLFSYLTEELHFSEGAAHRRIQSMKALKDLPELEDAILDGRVSITAASKMQTHFQEKAKFQEAYSPEQKRDLFQKIEGKSTRETESMIEELRVEIASATGPEIRPAEKERVLAHGNLQISFVADKELNEMLERVRELTAHQNPNPSYLELFKQISRVALQKLDPEERAKRGRAAQEENVPAEKSEGVSESPSETRSDRESPLKVNRTSAENLAGQSKSRSRYIPAAVRHTVWKRDQGCCQYADTLTGRKCGSRFGIEMEHRVPFGQGGEHSAENLVLFCKMHNLASAVRSYGQEKMKQYWQ